MSYDCQCQCRKTPLLHGKAVTAVARSSVMALLLAVFVSSGNGVHGWVSTSPSSGTMRRNNVVHSTSESHQRSIFCRKQQTNSKTTATTIHYKNQQPLWMAKDALQEDDDDDEDGKFLELGNEITTAFGPLGIITAGYGEEHLDLIIDACESAISQYNARVAQEEGLAPLPDQHLPVAVLGKSDLEMTFGRLLMELDDRDCVLPADGDELLLLSSAKDGDEDIDPASRRRNFNYLKYPLILFSGFDIPALQLSLRFIESMKGRLPMQPMAAMAVPKAMDKEVYQLLEELEGDHAGVMERDEYPSDNQN